MGRGLMSLLLRSNSVRYTPTQCFILLTLLYLKARTILSMDIEDRLIRPNTEIAKKNSVSKLFRSISEHGIPVRMIR